MYNDSFILRADFAKHELKPPAISLPVIPPHLVARIKAALRHTVEGCTERALRPGFQQHCLDWQITAMRAGVMWETSLEASIEKALQLFEGKLR